MFRCPSTWRCGSPSRRRRRAARRLAPELRPPGSRQPPPRVPRARDDRRFAEHSVIGDQLRGWIIGCWLGRRGVPSPTPCSPTAPPPGPGSRAPATTASAAAAPVTSGGAVMTPPDSPRHDGARSPRARAESSPLTIREAPPSAQTEVYLRQRWYSEGRGRDRQLVEPVGWRVGRVQGHDMPSAWPRFRGHAATMVGRRSLSVARRGGSSWYRRSLRNPSTSATRSRVRGGCARSDGEPGRRTPRKVVPRRASPSAGGHEVLRVTIHASVRRRRLYASPALMSRGRSPAEFERISPASPSRTRLQARESASATVAVEEARHVGHLLRDAAAHPAPSHVAAAHAPTCPRGTCETSGDGVSRPAQLAAARKGFRATPARAPLPEARKLFRRIPPDAAGGARHVKRRHRSHAELQEP